ncbi:ubiquitin-protein ligase peroxin 12 [Cryptotrichosporon argae]
MATRETPPLFPAPDGVDAPSIFELLAQDQLRDLLHPVFRYVLTFAAQHYPRYFLRLVNRHEEVFALVLLLLERHHLKKHNASISEHFYHLRLVPASRPTPRLNALQGHRQSGLSRAQRWGLLGFLVGVPYARARAQDLYERLGGRDVEAAGTGRGTLSLSEPEKAYRTLYPYANLALDLALLSYDVGYLFRRTAYRPWHTWLGVRIERRADEPEPKLGLLANLPPLLPPLLLALKAAQWWYSPASPRTLPSAKRHNVHAAITPPRPLPIQPESGVIPSDTGPNQSVRGGAHNVGASESPNGQAVPAVSSGAQAPPSHESAPSEATATAAATSTAQAYVIEPHGFGKCPLCKQKWNNPAVLPSGWVVCWRCGWDAITGVDDGRDAGDVKGESGGKTAPGTATSRRKGVCPITGVRVRVDELRRVLI